MESKMRVFDDFNFDDFESIDSNNCQEIIVWCYGNAKKWPVKITSKKKIKKILELKEEAEALAEKILDLEEEALCVAIKGLKMRDD